MVLEYKKPNFPYTLNCIWAGANKLHLNRGHRKENLGSGGKSGNNTDSMLNNGEKDKFYSWDH